MQFVIIKNQLVVFNLSQQYVAIIVGKSDKHYLLIIYRDTNLQKNLINLLNILLDYDIVKV